MDIQKIEKWLSTARWAPSGGNAQPWKVTILNPEKGSLKVSIHQEYRKKPSLLDMDGSASVLSLGAFVETLSQAAQLDGFLAEIVEMRPGATFFDYEIFLLLSDKPQTPLSDKVVTCLESIEKRATNRNRYQSTPLPPDLKDWMKYQCDKANIKIVAFESPEERLRLSEVLSQLEKLRWKNPSFLDDLLSEIGSDGKLGIPFYQLGVSSVEVLLLKTFKTFRFLRGLLRLGFTSKIAKQSIQKPLLRAPSFFYLVSDSRTEQAFFHLGMIMQRIWLAAQERGLGFQPMEGHLMAYHSLRSHPSWDAKLYPGRQRQILQQIAEKYAHNWGIDLGRPVFGFRIGYPCVEAKVSPRKTLDEICVKS